MYMVAIMSGILIKTSTLPEGTFNKKGIFKPSGRIIGTRKTGISKQKHAFAAIENNTLFVPNKSWGEDLDVARNLESALFGVTGSLHPKTAINIAKSVKSWVKGIKAVGRVVPQIRRNFRNRRPYEEIQMNQYTPFMDQTPAKGYGAILKDVIIGDLEEFTPADAKQIARSLGAATPLDVSELTETVLQSRKTRRKMRPPQILNHDKGLRRTQIKKPLYSQLAKEIKTIKSGIGIDELVNEKKKRWLNNLR